MKTIFIMFFSFVSLATVTFGWGDEGGCSSHKKITLAEQSNVINEVLVIRVDGIELHQLTDQQGEVLFNIRDIFGKELTLGLNLDELADQLSEIFKALSKS